MEQYQDWLDIMNLMTYAKDENSSKRRKYILEDVRRKLKDYNEKYHERFSFTEPPLKIHGGLEDEIYGGC